MQLTGILTFNGSLHSMGPRRSTIHNTLHPFKIWPMQLLMYLFSMGPFSIIYSNSAFRVGRCVSVLCWILSPLYTDPNAPAPSLESLLITSRSLINSQSSTLQINKFIMIIMELHSWQKQFVNISPWRRNIDITFLNVTAIFHAVLGPMFIFELMLCAKPSQLFSSLLSSMSDAAEYSSATEDADQNAPKYDQ